jgi:RecA-family ATPase
MKKRGPVAGASEEIETNNCASISSLHAYGLVAEHGGDLIEQTIVEGLQRAATPIDESWQRPPAHKPVGSPSASITIATASDLRTKEFPPIKYIVPGYIAEGCTLLAGRPKIGKSWFMLEVGLAAAGAGECLSGIKCEAGDVLYLALEDNERRLQSRITRLLGFSTGWPAQFSYSLQWPRANAGGLDQIRKWIANARKPHLIVVDVLAMFRSPRAGKESPYDADYVAIQGLQRIASDTGVAIVVVHHVRKGGTDNDPVEKVSGTLGLSGAADTFLILDRDSNGASLYGRGRDIEEIDAAVEFDRAECRWRVLGQTVEVRRTGERSSILTALRAATDPMAPSDLAAATGMRSDNVRQLLVKMAKADEVIRSARGRYLHPDHNPSPDHNDHKITIEDDG